MKIIVRHPPHMSSGVEIKAHFRSYEHVYLISHAQWKLIKGLWNACNIFTEQDPARNRFKIIMKNPARKIIIIIIVKHLAQMSESK